MHQSIQPDRASRESILDLPMRQARPDTRGELQGPVAAGPTWDEPTVEYSQSGALDEGLYVGGILYPRNEDGTIGSVENLPSVSGNSQDSTAYHSDDDILPMHHSHGISSQATAQVIPQIASQVTSRILARVISQGTSHVTSQGSATPGSSQNPTLDGSPILLDEATLQILEQEVLRIEAFVEHLDGLIRHLTDRSRDPNVEHQSQEVHRNPALIQPRNDENTLRQTRARRLQRFNMTNLQNALEATPSGNSSTIETALPLAAATPVGEQEQHTDEAHPLQDKDSKRICSAKMDIAGDE
ncbi:hypothetical protein DFP73DRAFT_530876 [Morchella snyderi]|nr:hypothetical protein DFP73DRAFT_530876 [Morchella snyderi]